MRRHARRLRDDDIVIVTRPRASVDNDEDGSEGDAVGQVTVSLHLLRSALLAGRSPGLLRVRDAELLSFPRGRGGGPITQGRGWQDSGILVLAQEQEREDEG